MIKKLTCLCVICIVKKMYTLLKNYQLAKKTNVYMCVTDLCDLRDLRGLRDIRYQVKILKHGSGEGMSWILTAFVIYHGELYRIVY